MGHYKSNTRDIEFNLFEVLEIQKPMADGAWGDLDEDTARTMVDEVARLSEGPLAESFAEADRNPPVFDPKTHTASIPEGFKKAFRSMWDGEWYRMGLAEDLGGIPAPRALSWSLNEMMLGSQPAAFMYAAGPAFAGVRVDHVDGLAQPEAYLHGLRARVGEHSWLLVEKILAVGETLPPSWPT